jgi:tetratricopeptide (TPR) repeat protein
MAERAFSALSPSGGVAVGTTDYYPIVADAVAGLADRSAQARQRVYARARGMLRSKLKATRPRLSPHRMRLEQRALDEVIARFEADARAKEASTRAAPARPRNSRKTTADRSRARLARVVVPAGLVVLLLVGAVSAYWLAGSRNTSPARMPPQATGAEHAPRSDTARVGAAATGLAPTVPRGCDPMLAATDLVACANADTERTEASERSLLPSWLSAYKTFEAAQRAIGLGRATSSTASAPASAGLASGARDLTESAKQSIKNGNLDRATRDLTAAIRAEPLYAEAYVIRGQARFQLGETEQAIADYNEGIRLDPRNAVAIRARGMAELYKGDEGAALSDLGKAIQIAEAEPARMPAIDLFYAHRNRAALFDSKQQYDREIYDLSAMIDAYWKDPLLAGALRASYRETGAASLIGSIYRLRAHAHLHKGTPDAAVTDLSFALELDQQHTVALLLERGHLQETLGRRDSAILDFQRVLDEFNPQHEEAKTALARLKAQASAN